MARIIIIIIIIVSWIYRKDYIFEEEEEGLKNSIPFEFLFQLM